MASNEDVIFDSILYDNPQITESQFKAFFLPLLTEDAKWEDRDRWLRIAGNGFMPVNVYSDEKDENGEHDFLFMTPPIDIRPEVNTKNLNMFEAVNHVMRVRNQHPQASKGLEKEMTTGFIGDLKLTDQSVESWAYIIENYDVPIFHRVKTEAVSDVPDVSEFDDW